MCFWRGCREEVLARLRHRRINQGIRDRRRHVDDAPTSTVEQVDALVTVNDVVPEQPILVRSEMVIAISVGNTPPVEEAIPESDSPVVADDATIVLPSDPR